eukprot:m.374257 g.374257  ORF g.374257 m.374257 type:complete len:449 (+) comp20899_c0_seq10:273-1619(+)
MGKKKGSKKKGSKKKAKGSGKKKASVTDDTILPAPERIMQYQLEARVELMKESRKQRDELLVDCKDLREEISEIHTNKQDIIDQIRVHADNIGSAIEKTTNDCYAKVVAAKQGLEDCITENTAETKKLNDQLSQAEEILADRVTYLKGLQHYDRVLRAAWDKKILQLRRARKQEQDDYAASANDLEQQFAHLRVHFGKSLDANIESAKYQASEAAISCQPVADKIKYQDNGWLHQEFEKHEAEHNRLLRSCELLKQAHDTLSAKVMNGNTRGVSDLHASAHSRMYGSAALPRQTSAPTLRSAVAARTRAGGHVGTPLSPNTDTAFPMRNIRSYSSTRGSSAREWRSAASTAHGGTPGSPRRSVGSRAGTPVATIAEVKAVAVGMGDTSDGLRIFAKMAQSKSKLKIAGVGGSSHGTQHSQTIPRTPTSVSRRASLPAIPRGAGVTATS